MKKKSTSGQLVYAHSYNEVDVTKLAFNFSILEIQKLKIPLVRIKRGKKPTTLVTIQQQCRVLRNI